MSWQRFVLDNRGLATTVVLAALLGGCGLPGPVHRQATSVAPAGEPAVAAPSNISIAPLTRTCVRSRGSGTALTAAQCASWTDSGPVNVIIVAPPGSDPYPVLLASTSPAWRPAYGRWLVAEARVVTSTGDCSAGWYPSRQQVELRLSAVSRRHFKYILLGCSASGRHLAIGDAHTDVWTRACGDHVVDFDEARDALVRSLVGGHGAVRVDYKQDYPAGGTYPGGCGEQVTADGRVAYVYLSDAASPGRVS